MADNYFCLDIGESYTKIVNAKVLNGKIDAQTIGYTVNEPSFFVADSEKVIDNQAEIIKKFVSGLKLTKKNVNIVIPDSATYSQIIEMPKLNEKELISAIRYQADQFIPMPIDETNIDLEIIYEFEKVNKILVLMVASAKKLIDKIQNTVELAGLIPDSIENELSATSRFIQTFYKGGIILVNFGFATTSLSYFEPTHALLVQNHTFNIGYNIFLKEIQVNTNSDIAKSMEILKAFTNVENIVAPPLKEFGDEIKRFASLITGKNYELKGLYFINDIYRFPYLPQVIAKAISIPSQVLNPYSLFKPTTLIESHKLDLPLYVSTIGGNLR